MIAVQSPRDLNGSLLNVPPQVKTRNNDHRPQISPSFPPVNFMGKKPFWEADCHSVSQEIVLLLRNANVQEANIVIIFSSHEPSNPDDGDRDGP
jgi:hypothetical protein